MLRAAEDFVETIRTLNWEEVLSAAGSNAKADRFQLILDNLMDQYFPKKTIRRREDGLPWINDVALKKIKKKKAVFRDECRSERWTALCNDLEEYLATKQEHYLEKQRDKMIGPEAALNFFKNVRNYSSAEKPASFNVRDLCPGEPDVAVANEVAEFFNKISQEFSPLDPWQIPTTYHRDLPKRTPLMVQERLQSIKKPNSMVEGDIFPKLVPLCAEALSIPLSDIYNCILETYVWPIRWKKEYVTVIPKKTLPSSFADLRNISCTALFSKVFESFVLQYASEEITIKNNQFGGAKGCSTSHMLIDIWQNICENSEDYRAATVMTSIDYAKAFNRMSFQHCLRAMKKKGSSSPIIRLIATFLTNRQMTVKVGESWSELLAVNGGCPQGSILGVFLFNLTTDDLEDSFMETERTRLNELPQHYQEPRDDPIHLDTSIERVGAATTSSPSSATHNPPEPGDLSPIGHNLYRLSDLVLHFNNYTVNGPREIELDPLPPEQAVGTQVLIEKKILIDKYIDDNIIVEKLNFGQTPLVEEDGKQIKKKEAVGSGNAFRSIKTNAEYKGMIVNNAKTNLICDSFLYLPVVFFLLTTRENELKWCLI